MSVESARVASPARPRRSAAVATPRDGLAAFSGLLLFTFVLFVAPTNYLPSLHAVAPAKTAGGLALLAYLINRVVTGRSLTVMTPPVRWGLLLAGIAVLSIPVSFWPGGSVETYVELFGKSLIIFLLIANVVTTVRRAVVLIGSMLAWGALAAVTAVRDYAAGELTLKGLRIAGYDAPLAGNPNDLALTLNILLGLTLGLHALARRRAHRLLLVGVIAVLVAGIVASFSRSGFVTLIAVGAMWAFSGTRSRGPRALVPVVAAGLLFMTVVPTGYGTRLESIVDVEDDPTGSISQRWESMVRATRYMAGSPVLGVGLGNNLHVAVARGEPAVEAHNAYLKLGAELGVPGLVVYVLFLLAALGAARAARRRLARLPDGRAVARLAEGVELALVAFIVGALFSPVPYHFYGYYPAGLAVAVHEMARRITGPATRGEKR